MLDRSLAVFALSCSASFFVQLNRLVLLADSYLEVLTCYEAQARKFRDEKKRPAVLVVDAVEDLEKTLMEEMIRRAKVPWAFYLYARITAHRCLCDFRKPPGLPDS